MERITRIEQLTLKQQEAIEWLQKNHLLLNLSGVERGAKVYPNTLHKWLKNGRSISLAVAQRTADWVIGFRA